MWAGFYNTFAQYLFFAAMLYTTVSVANILISTEALFNLLLVALFFRADEPLTPRLVILSLFILVGVILIIV
jgi:drug/metabolite transporter (DMT)-like permease